MPEWQKADALICIYQSVFDAKNWKLPKLDIKNKKLLQYELWRYIFVHIVLQLQDEVIVSDAERLSVTQSNVKMVLPFSCSPKRNVELVPDFYAN